MEKSWQTTIKGHSANPGKMGNIMEDDTYRVGWFPMHQCRHRHRPSCNKCSLRLYLLHLLSLPHLLHKPTINKQAEEEVEDRQEEAEAEDKQEEAEAEDNRGGRDAAGAQTRGIPPMNTIFVVAFLDKICNT